MDSEGNRRTDQSRPRCIGVVHPAQRWAATTHPDNLVGGNSRVARVTALKIILSDDQDVHALLLSAEEVDPQTLGLPPEAKVNAGPIPNYHDFASSLGSATQSLGSLSLERVHIVLVAAARPEGGKGMVAQVVVAHPKQKEMTCLKLLRALLPVAIGIAGGRF